MGIPAIDLRIIGKVAHVETIAVGGRIREIARLRKVYGYGRWRKRKGMPMPRGKSIEPTYVVCVDNRGYAASLELRKIYRIVPDAEASAFGQVRIIDESGEDYLYPQKYFISIQLPKPLVAALRRAS